MENSLLEQITILVETHGTITAIVIILLVLIVSLIKSKLFAHATKTFFKYLFNKWSTKTNSNNIPTVDEVAPTVGTTPTIIKVKESDILNHEIFNYIDFWLYSRIPTLEFSSDFRTSVFRAYLQIYFKSYKDTLHIFIHKGEYTEMEDSELKQAFLKVLTDTIFTYEKEMLDSNIPPVIVTKMKVKNNETLNLTIDLVNSICGLSQYNSENNLLKMFSLLNIIQAVLENTMNNSVDVCESLNGELKGLKYNGHIEK